MTSATVQAVAWFPNGLDGIWVAVRGRVTETPQEWRVTELEVLAACYAPGPFGWLVGRNDPAALAEVLFLDDRNGWRLNDALVDAYRKSHGEPEESETAVLRRMCGEMKGLDKEAKPLDLEAIEEMMFDAFIADAGDR